MQVEFKVEFWGGPRDGESYEAPRKPFDEFICMDIHEASINILEFYTQIKDHPLRTQRYHKYLLKETDNPEKYIYVYNGIL